MAGLFMVPSTGDRAVRHVGDCIEFRLRGVPPGWKARLRTNIGRAMRLREEIVRSHFEKVPLAGASWRDLVMEGHGEGEARLVLPLTEVGYFHAKAFAIDERGFQHWPHGADFGVSVHPSWTRTGNVIYCAFPRMFGAWSRSRETTAADHGHPELRALDAGGWTVIPPGGTLRALGRELPHIMERLGARIVHLLPVSPVPTTFARFGRAGSPYAAQDLAAIDPALVEFDRRTTGVQQFEELARGIHARGGRLMLDLVINHTGWGSREWNDHPEWFLRGADGTFHSPGAWGTVWEDLVEFDQRHVALWDYLARVFLTWCRRGVDAFRCDAGYKVPLPVWQYITARVRQEFPDTVFLLEGLGGSWEATDALLTGGGMQWAYSELFQNFGPGDIGGYLAHALRTSERHGTLVHYSETHDNTRLAARGDGLHAPLTAEGRRWSLHRNRLHALASLHGAFGYTNGVEWCATERVNVHSARGLRWGNPVNLVDELARLARLLREHPCFFDGARLSRVDPPGARVVALRRDSAEGLDTCLVLVNGDFDGPASVQIEASEWEAMGRPTVDIALVEPGPAAVVVVEAAGKVELRVGAGGVHCLAAQARPRGLAGEAYREARARADWGLAAWNACHDAPVVPDVPWQELARRVDACPAGFLASGVPGAGGYPAVVEWSSADATRVTLVPPSHWLMVSHDGAFRARLMPLNGGKWRVAESVKAGGRHVAAFVSLPMHGRHRLVLEPSWEAGCVEGEVLFLEAEPSPRRGIPAPTFHGPVALMTNGRGGMARLGIDLGRVTSKYDCLLGANLHARVPVDRHVLAKRLRAWINADGFITALDMGNLAGFEAGPPALWRFVANAGDGRAVEVRLVADMPEGSNTVVLQFSRAAGHPGVGRPLPNGADVRLTVRIDLEDRNFHWETRRHGAAEHHFGSCTRPLEGRAGFEFAPAPGRRLRAWADAGSYHPQPEWCEGLPHAVEATRGMAGSGDAWSPGWFELPLEAGESVHCVVTAEEEDPAPSVVAGFVAGRLHQVHVARERAGLPADDWFGRHWVQAAQAFVARRDDTRTVIAGYPWFLDWGRDSLIAARGLLAGGMASEVRDLLVTFARFEKDGTLPNSIHGENATNRDTSDAPLWLGIVAEELAGSLAGDAAALYGTIVDGQGRTLSDVLRSIASGYLAGTPNGIRVDGASGLVWSPGHFTWMDTNHPAGTPREGYPVEIQALWIRLLRQLARLGMAPWDGRGEPWADLARRAEKSFEAWFWLEDRGWLADCLMAGEGRPARTAAPSDALRSNGLMAVALDVVTGERARRVVEASRRHLVVPGALRSLAPLPTTPPLPIHGADGRLLNDPARPYWSRYEGDEDTRRKPAYHNGTAWTWTFPAFCEALVKAYPGNEAARAAARAYLGSMAGLMDEGCVGQLPEVLDGDAPHVHRGCDAQAWSATEVLRVWRAVSRGR